MPLDEPTRPLALSAELAARIADLQRRLDARALEAGRELPAERTDSLGMEAGEPPFFGVLPRAQARPSRPPPPPPARPPGEISCSTLQKQPRARLERAASLAVAVAIACGLGSYTLVADWLRPSATTVARARTERIHAITPPADSEAAPVPAAEAPPPMAARRSAPRALLRFSGAPSIAGRAERSRSAMHAPRSAELDSAAVRDGATAYRPTLPGPASRVDAFTPETLAVPSLNGEPTRADEPAGAAHARSRLRAVASLQVAAADAERVASRSLTPPAAAPIAARSPPNNLATEVRLLDFSVRGSLPRSVVHQALTRVLPQFSACHSHASAAGAAIRFDVSIDEVGRVRRPVVSGAAGAELERCLVAACAKLVSRAPDTGTVTVSWTLKFTPARSSQAAPVDRGF